MLRIMYNNSSSYLENYPSGRSPPQPGKNCACPSWLGPAPTHSALTSQAETGWMTSKPQMPGCAGTNIINLIYTKLSTFPSRKKLILRGISCSHFLRIILWPWLKKSWDTDPQWKTEFSVQRRAYSFEGAILQDPSTSLRAQCWPEGKKPLD